MSYVRLCVIITTSQRTWSTWESSGSDIMASTSHLIFMYQRCPGAPVTRHVAPLGPRAPLARWLGVTSLLSPLPSLLLLALRGWERFPWRCLYNVHVVVDSHFVSPVSRYICFCLSWPNPSYGDFSWRPPHADRLAPMWASHFPLVWVVTSLICLIWGFFSQILIRGFTVEDPHTGMVYTPCEHFIFTSPLYG